MKKFSLARIAVIVMFAMSAIFLLALVVHAMFFVLTGLSIHDGCGFEAELLSFGCSVWCGIVGAVIEDCRNKSND